MPQEAWVLKCYSCKKFQVQLKKKAKKWQCKVCGAKQDLMTIYFKGQPSDCRINVQNLNLAEGENLEKLHNNTVCEEENYYEDQQENISQNFQNHNYYSSNSEIEDFSENAMLNIDNQHKHVAEFSQNSQNQNSYSLKCEVDDFPENAVFNIDGQHRQVEEFSQNSQYHNSYSLKCEVDNFPENAIFNIDGQYRQVEEISQNFQNHNFNPLRCEIEDFSENAMLSMDRRCSQIEESNSQESVCASEHLNQNSESSVQENSTIEAHSQSNDNSNKDPFDINSIDFTIKTYKSPKKNVKNLTERFKLSIFESNSDFDESLDF